MTTISLAEAQVKLPELIAAVGRGEQVVVTIDDRPVARIEAASCESQPPAEEAPIGMDDPSLEGLTDEQKRTLIERGWGCMRGKIWMSDDFDEPLEEFAEYM